MSNTYEQKWHEWVQLGKPGRVAGSGPVEAALSFAKWLDNPAPTEIIAGFPCEGYPGFCWSRYTAWNANDFAVDGYVKRPNWNVDCIVAVRLSNGLINVGRLKDQLWAKNHHANGGLCVVGFCVVVPERFPGLWYPNLISTDGTSNTSLTHSSDNLVIAVLEDDTVKYGPAHDMLWVAPLDDSKRVAYYQYAIQAMSAIKDADDE